MNSPKVSIIIQHYRGQEILIKCIKSIRESTFNDYEVIIVDNNSTHRSLDNFEPSINESIVRAGWALSRPEGGVDFSEAESAAQSEGVGLWSTNFVSPSNWRMGQR